MEPLPRSFSQLLRSVFNPSHEFLFLDIGAYRGDFTRSLLEHVPSASAVLFEPTPDNYTHLKASFQDQPHIKVLNLALSDSPGTHDFHLCLQSATNSLLAPTQPSDQTIQVTVATLDQLFAQGSLGDSCHLIKIDTQGNDLNILKGGLSFLRKNQPWILTEVIFVDLYAQQAPYYQILDFFNQEQYSLAGIFNLHYTAQGFAGYADFLFVPNVSLQQHPSLTAISDTFQCFDGDHWMRQAQVFEQACIERLNLIQDLNQVASDRLQLIERLDAEIKQLRAEITALRGE
jgi:FkbM family methyltransferase